LKRLSVNSQVISVHWVCEGLKELTADVDLQLTEDRVFIGDRILHDDVSVRRHVAGTLQVDCRRGVNGARVLTADSVVPEGRCRDAGRDIGQTDDEIVRSVGFTEKSNLFR